jgi:hypothetical protein
LSIGLLETHDDAAAEGACHRSPSVWPMRDQVRATRGVSR